MIFYAKIVYILNFNSFSHLNPKKNEISFKIILLSIIGM